MASGYGNVRWQAQRLLEQRPERGSVTQDPDCFEAMALRVEERLDYLQQYIDLRRQDIEPERFAIVLAVRYIRGLIHHGGSDMSRPDLESALHPEHLESFLAHAVEIPWKDARLAQEWRQLQQILPRVREAWKRGQRLFQEALEQAKSDQESMEYFSMIDFAVDCYARVAASRVYPDQPALRNWVVNAYMLLWRQHFLTDGDGLAE